MSARNAAADIVFKPSADADTFRLALGQFATGVTVITTVTEQGPVGITANSFTSVSLDPPLVLWCPAKAAKRHDFFMQAQHFAIHVLGSDQLNVCEEFARSWGVFSDYENAKNEAGVPIIPGCLAVFECQTTQTHDAGDHTIIVGEVYRARQRDGDPLAFSQGAYLKLSKSIDS